MDAHGVVLVNTITPNKKYMAIVRLLRSARGRTVEVVQGRRRATVMRLRDGYVQYLKAFPHHDPKTGAVGIHSLAFFGHGMSVGPQQRAVAIVGPKSKQGRVVWRQYVAEYNIHDRRHRRAPGLFGAGKSAKPGGRVK